MLGYISVLFLQIVITTLCSLVRRVYDKLACVQDCTTSYFQPACFGKKGFLLKPMSAPKRGMTAQHKIEGVRLRRNDECARGNV